MVWPEDGHSGCVYNSSFPSLNDSCVEHITTHRLSNLTNVCWFRCEIHSVQCRGRINVDSVCVRSWANLWAEKDTNHLKVKWNEMYIQREMIEYRDDKHAEQTNERKENETHNWNIGQYTYINTYIWLENLLTKRFSPYFPIIQWKKARNRTRSEPKLNLCHCLSALIANGRPMF